MTLLSANPRYRFWFKRLAPLVPLLVLGWVVWRLRHVLAGHSLDDIWQHLHAIPHSLLLLALLCIVGSYSALAAYDLLALRYIGERVRAPRALMTSFIAFTLSHNIGLATVSAFAVRMRLYGELHLTARRILLISAFCSFTTALGSASLLTYALLTQSGEAHQLLHLPVAFVRVLGWSLLLVLCAYGLLVVVRRSPFRLGQISVMLPAPGVTILQLTVAILDLCLASAALYLLLPVPVPLSYHAFLALYVLSMLLVTVSNVPGGLGVLEAVILLALPTIPVDQLLASLIAFRVLYYLLPLCLAAALFAANELRTRHDNRSPAPPIAADASEPEPAHDRSTDY